ncbi:MAG TPA: M28 family peptidase [Gemmatimonadales bacterium]|nr:M28 family peptidase [Gemmatimonadales bacterium]
MRAFSSMFLLALWTAPLAAQSTPESYTLLSDVRYLASDQLGGRITGSPGADSAAAYIARRFAQAGLQPSSQGWFQPFEVSRDAPAVAQLRLGALNGRNVIGVLPGKDPVLRNEIVIVGAHYDHLGLGGPGSGALDPDVRSQVHNGADDNASGAAALIHIATRLAANPPGRTVVFIAFSGEELGLLGSAYYVKHPLYPLAGTEAMVNLDMVGRLRNKRLIVYGVETAKEFPALLDSLNWYAGFDLKAQGDGYGPSDQQSFFIAKRPVLHLFTDLHEDYHRASDDWDKINADGLLRVADYTTGIVRALANRPGPLTFVDAAPPNPHAGTVATPGYGAYLGTIPDMTDNPGGVEISGVRPGSPAEKAGLTAGDIIVKIGDTDVTNLQAMTDALRSHVAGDVVQVQYLRGGNRLSSTVTLGVRPAS